MTQHLTPLTRVHSTHWQKLSAAILAGVTVFAGGSDQPGSDEIALSELARFDLETLLNLEVTSASRKEEKLSDSATAIHVITQEDIRRSGHTTLPELFRLVPGMQVARVDAGHWAITSRGFNDPYADKLLVLIDGRAVYNPVFGGVYWEDQTVVLDDLDRIEVIRGPGATLWGANAVNGVINVITRKARETQGVLLTATAGTHEQPSTSLRYGGRINDQLHYRVHAQYFNHQEFESLSGRSMHDDWQIGSGGLRLDWEPTDSDLLTLEGGYFSGRFNEEHRELFLTPPYEDYTTSENHNRGGHVLGRWTHAFSDESELSIQGYFDHSQHREFDLAVEQNTLDLEVQHRFPLGERHEIIWGAGYRYLPDEIVSGDIIHFTDESERNQVASAFIQDEISLVEDRLKFTWGSKFEHNDFTGFELQPSARLLFKPAPRQTLWASVARAVRTPTRVDASAVIESRAFPPGPGTPPVRARALPNEEFDSEEVIANELGYRIRPHDRLSFDLAGFFNRIDGSQGYPAVDPAFETQPVPHIVQANRVENYYDGISYGAEVSAEWALLDNLRLHAGYTWIDFDIDPDEWSVQSTPHHQFQVRAHLDLTRSLQLMGAAYHVSSITATDGVFNHAIPDYFRLDLGISWRPIENLELGLWGQNLLDPVHPEFGSYRTSRIAEIPRSVVGKVTWSF